MATFTNARDGRTVESNLTHSEAGIVVRRRNGNFARDLADRCARNQALSATQLFWLHLIAQEVLAEEAARAAAVPTPAPQQAAPPAGCPAPQTAPAAAQPAAPAWSFPTASIVAFLEPASQSRKSGACVTFQNNMPESGMSNNGTVQIKRITERNSRNRHLTGHYYVSDGAPFPNSKLYGRITPAGDFVPHRNGDDVPPAGVLALLDEFQNDPFRFIQQYGIRTGRCCFCDLPLEDPASVKLGYGPVCAKHYRLPHGPKAVAAFEAGKPLSEQKPKKKGVEMASDLGWTDGWPEGFAYKGLWYTRGAASYDREGDCESVQYTSGKEVLIVYND